MEIAGATALVTGANRGLGRHLAEQLVARGATVYAGARNPDAVDLPGVIPVRIDITDEASIAAAADVVQGLTLLVNNAGIATGATFLDGSSDDIRRDMETNYYGTLAVTRAFAPQLTLAPGRSGVLNVLSVLSWYTLAGFGPYSAAKSAAWSLTNALRNELAPLGTQVTALHVAFIDTDMARHVDAPKAAPAEVARLALDGVEDGLEEVLADDVSRRVQAGLAGGVRALYPKAA
jgi:NAD(P)-dependent dehydrogenase (short-subunit alcohol dehydrogenase family)